MKEVEIIMEQLGNKLPEGAHINFGVSVDEKQIGLKVVILVTEAWKEPLVEVKHQSLPIDQDLDRVNWHWVQVVAKVFLAAWMHG